MDLGDGLKLETQFLNGKPKLILAPYDASSKDAKGIKYKNRTTTHPLRSKQILQEVASTHESNSKTEKPLLKHAVTYTNTIVASGKGENAEQLIADKKTDNKTKNNGETAPKNGQSGSKTTVKKLAITKQQPPKKQKTSSEELRENLVCLTQEQLQQILASISQVNKNSSQNQERDKSTKPGNKAEATGKELKGKDNATLPNGVGCANNEALQNNSSSQDPQTTNKSGSNVEQANTVQTEKAMGNNETLNSAPNQVRDGLFRHLGERENDKDQLEAKRIQWKKELDEQVALKKQLQKGNATSEFLEWNPWGRPGAGAPIQSNAEKILATYEEKSQATLPAASGPYTDGRVISTAPTVAKTTNTTVPSDGNVGKASSFSFPDLPAAIRSAFVLGEFAPLEHPFSAVKREQQKKWLQELDKQREEEKIRKLQEKLKYSEGDDHNRWAMHFDSYQKKPNQQTPVSLNTCGSTLEKSPESGNGQQSDLQQFPAQAVPALSHHNSSTGENTGSIVVDPGSELLSNTQKASFLRSMTALLDPAQIEERDLRRKKQLENQKAIAIQVEERRKQKQLEEDQKRKEELKEELRLAKERERLKQQYEEETRTQREKEELHNRKTNLLYETVQRAQEEAQRQKQEQRIRELVRKGHDISNLQKNVEGTISCMSSCKAPSRLVCEEVSEVVGQITMEKDSPRKDRGIQTEDFELIGKVKYNAQVIDHSLLSYTPDKEAECDIVSNIKKTKKKPKPNEKMVVTGKENVLQSDDAYNQFARTKKGKNEKRPEWNTNKTNKRYVPASERYPKSLQREREEKKTRRQMELLQLLEKSAPEHQPKKKQSSKEPTAERLPSPVVPALQAKVAVGVSSQPVEKQGLSVLRKEDPAPRSKSNSRLPADKDCRCESPPVPALRNKQLQMEQKELHIVQNMKAGEWCQRAVSANESDNDRPPSSNFVPYVRTDEVYHLDPDAPMSRPSTHDPQYMHCNDDMQHQSYSSDHPRDPLLNPDLVRNRERQQAILKGLSELRQGLMQKQRELETGLTSSPLHQDEQYSVPSQHL